PPSPTAAAAPPRRSSDLSAPQQVPVDGGQPFERPARRGLAQRLVDLVDVGGHAPHQPLGVGGQPPTSTRSTRRCARPRRAGRSKDRKSTRLNSSHVKSSY